MDEEIEKITPPYTPEFIMKMQLDYLESLGLDVSSLRDEGKDE